MFSSFHERLDKTSRTIITLLSLYTNNNIAKLIEKYLGSGMKGLRYTN